MGRRDRALAVAIGLLLGACDGCDETQVSDAGSSLLASTLRLELGAVYVGTEARGSFALSAPGELPVEYGLLLLGDAFGFQVGPAVGQIGANGRVEFVVLFRPGRPGRAEAQVLVQSNATRTESILVELAGDGVLPPDCEDGNGCTRDHFDFERGSCVHVAEAVRCDDFDLCTVDDLCAAGVCLGRGMSCDDGDACTDDLCDPRRGCVNNPTRRCDDGNPCTIDGCDAVGACTHRVVDDGQPCDDGEQCTSADICLAGRCVGVTVPDGTMCDDGEPCSKNDQCVEGECKDPDWVPRGIGEVKFDVEIPNLAPDAAENPILDRDSNLYLSTSGGVVALDRCGLPRWERSDLGAPRWSGALALPGRLFVPVGRRVLSLDTATGDTSGRVDLAPLFGLRTASTSTPAVRVLDLVARASGALLVSAIHEPSDGPREGLIAEIDRGHVSASRFLALGALHAARLAVDRDESLIALLSEDPPGAPYPRERIARFGVSEGLSWATTGTRTAGSDLALGPQGEVLWTRGLLRIATDGTASVIDPRVDVSRAGSPALSDRHAYFTRRVPASFGPSLLAGGHELAAYALTGTVGIAWTADLAGTAGGMSPVADARGRAFVLSYDGVLHAFEPDGRTLFAHRLPEDRRPSRPTALALSFDRVVVVVSARGVVGVQSDAPIAASAWPRHRRDNLSTGHR